MPSHCQSRQPSHTEAEAAAAAEAEAAGAFEAVQGAEAVVSGGVAEAAVCRGVLAASARLGHFLAGRVELKM
jgi:hypothetical protein